MPRALIRLIESTTVDVEGEGLPEIQAKLAAATPDGFELVSAPVQMAKASSTIAATGTFARRDETREITADSRAELDALVPEGWQMLYVIGE